MRQECSKSKRLVYAPFRFVYLKSTKKKPQTFKSGDKFKLFVKWLQPESEALFHLIEISIYSRLNIHFCSCDQTLVVPLTLIGCPQGAGEQRLSVVWDIIWHTSPTRRWQRTQEKKCTFVDVKVLGAACPRPRRCAVGVGSPPRGDISTLQTGKKEQSDWLEYTARQRETKKKQILGQAHALPGAYRANCDI